MYIMRKLENANRIPPSVYVDSPMAISVTDLYMRHHEDHDQIFTKKKATGTARRAHRALYAHRPRLEEVSTT